MPSTIELVKEHYGSGDIISRIDVAAAECGLDGKALSTRDLAPLDQFHLTGINGTEKLADVAGISKEDHVLDVGCGIGGPARFLAESRGCSVTGLDLTPTFVQAAEELTRRMRLSDRVQFTEGDALNLPFEDQLFSAVWLQHANMNIPDKRRLFSEIRRVLVPGGRLAMHEVFAGPGGDVIYPVPWSRDGRGSFLVSKGEAEKILESLGMQKLHSEDTTQESVEWFEASLEKLKTSQGPMLGLPVLVGPIFKEMAANALRCLREDRVKPVMAVWQKND